MAEVTRRDFIKIFGGGVVGAGLAGGLISSLACGTKTETEEVEPVLQILKEVAANRPPVIWLQGAGCTGCSVSLLNSVHPDIAEILLKIISLNAHQTVMAATGSQALAVFEDAATNSAMAGQFYLVVEGAVPTAEEGKYAIFGEKTVREWVEDLGAKAAAVVAVGTCAAFGGIPASNPTQTNTGMKPVSEILTAANIATPVMNIPGCPPHPDWIVGSVAHVLLYGLPELDSYARPTLFYGDIIHRNCPRFYDFENERYAQKLGDEGCLVFLGCKGPIAHADCPQRQWNNGTKWCVGAQAPCIGCVQPEFPDGLSPLYSKVADEFLAAL